MQVTAFARVLQSCSRPAPAAYRSTAISSRSTTATFRCFAAASSLPFGSRGSLRRHPAAAPRHAPLEKTSSTLSAKDSPDKDLPVKESLLSVDSLSNLSPDHPYIFTSRTRDPYENLAIEHHLLTYSHPQSHILFTYENTPCVVIGRNQNPWVECDLAQLVEGLKSSNGDGKRELVQLVRRRSGGGTVFHGPGNLNYTVIVPNDPKDGKGFQRRTHVEMVVTALKRLERNKEDFISSIKEYDDIKVNERNDIVILPHTESSSDCEMEFNDSSSSERGSSWLKVSGTAFKLTRGRALHHGTLLYASPHLDSISPLLRSPAREHITAKGVESVRSPVANLYKRTTEARRNVLLNNISNSIRYVWRHMIDPDGQDAAHFVTNPTVSILGLSEGATPHWTTLPKGLEKYKPLLTVPMTASAADVPELKAGIEELRSEAWMWDQTPGFSFDSGPVEDKTRVFRLKFQVKGGVITSVDTTVERIRQELETWKDFNSDTEILKSGPEETLVGKKIHELSAGEMWKASMQPLPTMNQQIWRKMSRVLEMCFPSLQRRTKSRTTDGWKRKAEQERGYQAKRKQKTSASPPTHIKYETQDQDLSIRTLKAGVAQTEWEGENIIGESEDERLTPIPPIRTVNLKPKITRPIKTTHTIKHKIGGTHGAPDPEHVPERPSHSPYTPLQPATGSLFGDNSWLTEQEDLGSPNGKPKRAPTAVKDQAEAANAILSAALDSLASSPEDRERIERALAGKDPGIGDDTGFGHGRKR